MKDNITSQTIKNLFFEFQSKLLFFERKFLKSIGINDITPNEAKILHLIVTTKSESMSEIAHKLNITYGTLSTTINALVKKGYLLRTRHKPDRRNIVLFPTKKCTNVANQHEMFHINLINQLFEENDKKKIFILNNILNKLNLIVENSFEQISKNQK